MARTRTVLFVQGGGEGSHDAWDDKLVASLRAALGDGFDVRYPRLPHEDDPSEATWGPVIRREVAALDADAVVIGHSVGGTILVRMLAEWAAGLRLGAIVLLASPFVGSGGWPGDEFELPDDLGARLPPSVPVHYFYGLDDDTVPAAHVDLYARAVPRMQVHRLPGRDHQLGNDLGEVASVIRALPPEPDA
ncbi:MAG TPA: alpha/beta fold hydrolase [Candidatus Limnocylindrales bacterium]|nr:alpha/beta fold hydrolase [Candidatus Limnocylindrales bacterium]